MTGHNAHSLTAVREPNLVRDSNMRGGDVGERVMSRRAQICREPSWAGGFNEEKRQVKMYVWPSQGNKYAHLIVTYTKKYDVAQDCVNSWLYE